MAKYSDEMIQQFYVIFDTMSFVFLYIFNLLNFKKKSKIPSRLSVIYRNFVAEKGLPGILGNATLITLFEIILMSFMQYQFCALLGVNWFVGDYVGTGANYYGILLFSPLFLQILFMLISVNPFKQMDLITPAYSLALFFGKCACFCTGCCGGFEWAKGFYNHERELVAFPTQLVEAGLALLIFIVLLLIRKKVKEGTLYPIFVILYSATRFISEFTRYEDNIFLIFKRYHFMCIFGLIVGIAQYTIIKNNREKIYNFYDKSCCVIIDFFYVVIDGFGFKREKKVLHRKKNRRDTDKKRTQLSDVKFDFHKIRMWILIWTLGLVGQIGWNVEGTWFNTFVYEKIDKNPSIITPMLILSALATTVAIYVFGSLTDKTGKRRNLINLGYIIWGILLMLFATTQIMVKNYFSFAIVCVVLGDMLISFFGSMSMDVGYSTWLTDIMNDENRGQIGAAIAVQSILGSLLGNIINSKLIGYNNNYTRLFVVVGTLLFIFGIISAYLFNKSDDIKIYKNKFKPQIKEPFNFRILLKNKELMLIYVCVAIFFTGFNTYFPYLGNYLIHYLGYSAEQMGIIEAIPLVLAMLVTVPVSKYINNNKFIEVSLIAVVSGLIGMLFIYPIIPESINLKMIFDIRLFMAILLIGSSYVIMLQATKSWTKMLAPKNSKGRFEVFYAIAFAVIPMTFGSTVGENIVKMSSSDLVNEITGRVEYIPNGNIFLIGTLISMFSIIPIIMIKIYSKKQLAVAVNE